MPKESWLEFIIYNNVWSYLSYLSSAALETKQDVNDLVFFPLLLNNHSLVILFCFIYGHTVYHETKV